jgi:hypothetical protein
MLTGQQPYHGDTPMSVVVKHITDPVPHILDVKPDLPTDIEAVIEKAMAKDRTVRFQNVRSLADALTAVSKGEKPDMGPANATVVSSPKTVAGRRPVQTLEETILSKRAAQVQTTASGKGSGIWIGLGVVVLLLVVGGGAAALIFRNKLPFLAASGSTATASTSITQNTPFFQVTNSNGTAGATQPPAASDTPAPSPTATQAGPLVIGGTDLIAFTSDNDIWTISPDGSNPKQLTKDATEKHDLQWAPDGQSLYFISGKCVYNLALADDKATSLVCFNNADQVEAFEISPDATQVAISLARVLYVVPFDTKAISAARNWTQLRDMKGCFTYGNLHGQPAIKYVRWSSDGKQLAADALTMSATGRVDSVLVFDISKCDSNVSTFLDNIPGSRFTMTGYNKNPVIPSFDWDGQSLILLNSVFRFDFGYLYAYNIETKRPADLLSPLKSCCYTSATWSPDGSYLMFAYQDIDGSGTQIYYIPYGTLSTGATYQPLSIPEGFFKRPADQIEFALRSTK